MAAPVKQAAATGPAVFAVEVITAECFTPSCSFSANVTNVGGSPADATVYLSASSGLGPTPTALGVIPPGERRTASAATPNPAPPGGRVLINYRAWVYSAALHGPDPALVARLEERGLGPGQQPKIAGLQAPYQALALRALDAMTRAYDPTDQVANDAALVAVQNAITNESLPELGVIVASGERFLNPQDLPALVTRVGADTQPPPDDQDEVKNIGIRRELQQIVEILRSDPGAQVVWDGTWTDPATGQTYKADVLDVTNRRCLQIKTTQGANIPKQVGAAANQLQGRGNPGTSGQPERCPPDWETIAIVYTEPGEKSTVFRSKEDLEAVYFRKKEMYESLCDGPGRPRMAELVIVTGRGVHRWPSSEFTSLTGRPC